MSINLLEVLTEEDRIKIENYIHLYGTCKDFIGLDQWLSAWSDNKPKLYQLLGGKLIYKVPYSYEKTEYELRHQMHALKMDSQIEKFCYACRSLAQNIELANVELNAEVHRLVADCCHDAYWVTGELPKGRKFKFPNAKKTFQVQAGAKPIKTLGKFLNYCIEWNDPTFSAAATELLSDFENLRLKHSIILNDKIVRGNLCFSIHPLDFLTMSDNASKWQSCMSWVHKGCYRAGTVEMLNSNNVICCYLENENSPFYFGEKRDIESDSNYEWNNKKWRQLVYITKDIIVTGKPYPFENEGLSKKILEVLRSLAKENLKWTYSFGPELYKDMKYINSTFSIERAKSFIKYHNTTKHNILFHTKGMYNDMLNDSLTPYWCIRNKVNHTKVITYSGKAPCMCCGEPIIEETCEDYDYNDRYYNVNSGVCDSCLELTRCYLCKERDSTMPRKIVYTESGKEILVCEDCEQHYVLKCPCCGKPFYAAELYDPYCASGFDEEPGGDHVPAYIKIAEKVNPSDLRNCYYDIYNDKKEIEFSTAVPVFICNDCLAKDSRFEFKTETIPTGWGNGYKKSLFITKEVVSKDDWRDYLEVKHAELAEGEILTC